MAKKCPKCDSTDVEIVELMGSKVLLCNSCGYDESEEDLVVASSSGKKSRNVYRTGGGRRSA